MNQRIRVLRELGGELERAVEHAPTPPVIRLPRQRFAVLAVALVALLLAAVALAATGAFSSGAPVKPGPGDLTTPHSGGGAVVAQSVQGIAALAEDPAGGPPWGMRMLRTTRGLGCLQAGRVVDGRLGVLGQDGAFANDGRFHPLPPQISNNPVDCGALDAHGHLYWTFASQGVVASAYPLGCTPPGDVEPHPNPPLCSQADERAIYGGLLGPQAVSITYATPAGSTVTVPVGPDGAYLIVQRANPKLDLGGANLGGLLPPPGNGQPIRQITYRGGLVCQITAVNEVTNRGLPCSPPGYVRPLVHKLSERLLAAPFHFARRIGVRLDGHPADDLEVSFVSHVAVTGATSRFVLNLQLPNGGPCHGQFAGTQTMQDYAPGQIVHLHYTGAAYAGSFLRCRGHFTGTILYVNNTTGEGGPLPAAPGSRTLRVGSFSFTVR